MFSYGVFSGLHFPVFGMITDQSKTLYLDTFHSVYYLPEGNDAFPMKSKWLTQGHLIS